MDPSLNYYSAEYALFPLTFRAGVCIPYPLSMAAYVTWSGFTVDTVYFSDHCLWAWPCYLHWPEGCCHTWLEHRSMHACLSFPVVLQPFQLEKMPSVATSPRKMRDKWRKFEMNPQLEPNLHYIGQIPAHAQTHEQDINVNIIWHWHLRAFKSNIIIACLRYMHKCTKRHVQDCLWQHYLKNIAKNLKQYK